MFFIFSTKLVTSFLLTASKALRISTGNAKITGGHNLPASYVIHTVGPVWQGGKKEEENLLSSCYKRSLEIAVKKQLKTIAFPNISTGIYGFPKEKAAGIAISTVTSFLNQHAEIEKVIFAVFDEENYEIYQNLVLN